MNNNFFSLFILKNVIIFCALGITKEEQLKKAREERANIVSRYDRGREAGAIIDAWEDPNYELYHKTDRYGFIQ